MRKALLKVRLALWNRFAWMSLVLGGTRVARSSSRMETIPLALTLRPFLLYLACELPSWPAEAVSIVAESPSDSVSLRALAAAPPPDVLLLLRKERQTHKKI